MGDEETSIRVYQSTKSRLRKQKFPKYVKSDDGRVNFLCEEMEKNERD